MRKLLTALLVTFFMTGLSQESYAISDQASGGSLSGSDCPINYHYNYTIKNCVPDAIIKRNHTGFAPLKPAEFKTAPHSDNHVQPTDTAIPVPKTPKN
jgi:hypothetical protein